MPIRMTVPVLRASLGWTPGKLAQVTGLSYSLVHKAEQGQRISKNSAEKICKALGVELSQVEGLYYK